MIVGAQIGGRAINRWWARPSSFASGSICYALGHPRWSCSVISLDVTWWKLLPGLVLYGAGIGHRRRPAHQHRPVGGAGESSSGVASGANTTARQLGGALGVAVIGSLLSVQTIRHATDQSRVPADRG